jgi:hypothetical protein
MVKVCDNRTKHVVIHRVGGEQERNTQYCIAPFGRIAKPGMSCSTVVATTRWEALCSMWSITTYETLKAPGGLRQSQVTDMVYTAAGFLVSSEIGETSWNILYNLLRQIWGDVRDGKRYRQCCRFSNTLLNSQAFYCSLLHSWASEFEMTNSISVSCQKLPGMGDNAKSGSSERQTPPNSRVGDIVLSQWIEASMTAS